MQYFRLSGEGAMGEPMDHSHVIQSPANEKLVTQSQYGVPHDMESPLPGTLHHVSPGQSRTSPMSGSMHQVSPGHYSPRNQSTAENIKQILTCGKITAEDLTQQCLLGVGNGGQVYK